MAKFCKNCGNQLIEGDAFCEVCGSPVTSTTEGQNTTQPQPGFVQLNAQYQNNTYSPQPQPKKNNSTLLIVIIVVIAVVVLALGGFILYHFLTGGTGNEPKNQIESQANTHSTYESIPPKHETAESDYEVSESNYETTQSDYEPINTDNNTDSQTPNTLEDPTQEDFGWITGVTSPPFGAEILTESADISGQWKAYLDYSQVGAQEYAVVNIIADSKTARVEWSIRQIDYDGTGFRNGPDKLYYLDGVFDEGYLNATGEIRGDFTVTSFYKLGSKQYALGTMINPSGDTAYVYLVR